MKDWILRFVKGMFIGSGFILPGISGGALAAVFGIYERIISSLANITKDVKENTLFFLPVALGALTGIFLLSFAVSFLLGNYEAVILWFFVGCIVGTIPTLWQEAGKKGRGKADVVIMAAAFVIGVVFLWMVQHASEGNFPQNTLTWVMAGAIIGLGMIVPGLSPSNFLVFLGIYKGMSDGIKHLDAAVIIPIAVGALICVLTLSKVMEYVFSKAYAKLFHIIMGIVVASTVMIIPLDYSGVSTLGIIMCPVLCIAGALVGWWMCQLEDRYK